MASSSTLRKRLADLEAFVSALNKLVGTLEPVQAWSGPPRYAPRPGMEAQANRLRFDVDRAAGRAAYAFAEAGSFVNWSPRGTMNEQRVNPATEWATVVSGDPKFGLDVLMACSSQALGVLEMKVEAAEEEERNPPPRAPQVRRIRASHLTPIGRWAGTVVAGLVVAGVVYWLGWR